MSEELSPLSPKELTDLYFLDARHKLIELAAFLDRLERSRKHARRSEDDYRMLSFKEALACLAAPGESKAKAVQMIFSDPTTGPLESAAGMKGASGAWPGKK